MFSLLRMMNNHLYQSDAVGWLILSRLVLHLRNSKLNAEVKQVASFSRLTFGCLN